MNINGTLFRSLVFDRLMKTRRIFFTGTALIMSVLLVSVTGVSSVRAAVVPSVDLGSARSFAVLAQTYVTTGAPSIFHGNVGAGGAITTGADNEINGTLYAGAAVTTGASDTVDGNIYAGAAITTGASTAINGSVYAGGAITKGAGTTITGAEESLGTVNSSAYSSAMSAVGAAIRDASGRSATTISTELAGSTLVAGVYSAVSGGFLTLAGNVTFDAQNNPDAIFIIKSPTYISAAVSSSVRLVNGAVAANIFWVPLGYFSVGASAILSGNILATGYVSLGAGAAVHGRIFSKSGYVGFGAGPSLGFGIPGIGTTTTMPKIPDVVGMVEAVAAAAVINAGFARGTVSLTTNGATAANHGTVSSYSPSGSQPYGTAVNFVFFSYIAPGTTPGTLTPTTTAPGSSPTTGIRIGTVPNVIGMGEPVASIALTNVGFVRGTITFTTIGATPANHGTVARYTPSGSQPIGTTIDLVLFFNVKSNGYKISTIYFARDSAFLTVTAKKKIRTAVSLIRARGVTSVALVGHTDSAGGPSYNNLALSQRRSISVKKYLKLKLRNAGISVSRLGKADANSIASNKTAAGRKLNRRVEILIP